MSSVRLHGSFTIRRWMLPRDSRSSATGMVYSVAPERSIHQCKWAPDATRFDRDTQSYHGSVILEIHAVIFTLIAKDCASSLGNIFGGQPLPAITNGRLNAAVGRG